MTVTLPPYHSYMWPTLVALRALGGSGSNAEINEAAVLAGDYSDEQQQVLHGDGPLTEIQYRMHWARTYLKGMGLAINSARGVWSLTERGKTVTQAELGPLRSEYTKRLREKRLARAAEQDDDQDSEQESAWTDQLLDRLLNMKPDAFERLAQRLLREADFISVNVTGKSGDGGIDGVGTYRLSLISFPVYFQCKRYKGSVGPGEVRDFRGAMAGRGDKGLLITTGSFSAEARKEANRDGAPALDLIDGLALCDLLKRYDLGVTTTIRQEEDIVVDPGFFDTI